MVQKVQHDSYVCHCSELYRGMASMAFSPEIVSKLEAPLNPDDVEIKLDGESMKTSQWHVEWNLHKSNG